MDLSAANKLWYSRQPVGGVLFGFNDYVRVKSGEFAGEYGSIAGLISLDPVTYLLELDLPGGGGNSVVAQSEIEMIEPANGGAGGET